jgi:hypothetical protein
MGYSQGAVGTRQDILILPGPNALASRLWHQILGAADEAGVDRALVEVVQGSYNPGGVEASGTTHADGGAYDLRLRGISDDKAVQWAVALRKRGACAFPRIERFGWTAGRHIHAVDRYEPDLSRAAAWQVGEYDAHRNALSGSSSAHDPIPHPTQIKFEEDDVALSDADIQKVAEAVWALKGTDPITSEVGVSQRTILARTRINSKQAVDKIDDLGGGTSTLTSADKDDIASRVADLLAIRLKG